MESGRFALSLPLGMDENSMQKVWTYTSFRITQTQNPQQDRTSIITAERGLQFSEWLIDAGQFTQAKQKQGFSTHTSFKYFYTLKSSALL